MKYIDFESSFAFVSLNEDCAWRLSVKSLLINLTDNNSEANLSFPISPSSKKLTSVLDKIIK